MSKFVHTIFFRDAQHELVGILTDDEKLLHDFGLFLANGKQESFEYKYITGRPNFKNLFPATLVVDFRSVVAIKSEAWSDTDQ